MVAVMDAQARMKKQQALLHLAEDALRQMRADAEVGHSDVVDAKAKKFEDILKAEGFPNGRSSEFRDRVRAIQCAAHQKSVDDLLHEVECLARAGNTKAEPEVLTKVRDHMASAMRFGADEGFRKGVDRRVALIAQLTGEGIDKRTKEAAVRKAAHDLEAKVQTCKGPGGIERRRAIRYVEPVLTATIDGETYRAVNWSAHGLLIEGYAGDLAPGDWVKLDLACEGLPGQGRETARVVRHDSRDQTIAFDFGKLCPVVLHLSHAMKAAGLAPVPQR